ncbi:MAG TPA: acyl-CoA dehydrogenase family protein [Polyangiales bacterium]|nr:acyl-CoA dehydrogenase family protein [Polyangiales bacterium]
MSGALPSAAFGSATAPDALAAVEALRAIASAHAAESERLRTLAPPVVAALRASGLLGFSTAEALGGGGASPRAQFEVVEAMARVDTATGWSLMISSMLSACAGAYLSEEGVREVFADGVPICAGLLMPSGVLRAAPGGFRVHGRWAFGSGIRHAEWIVTSALVQSTDAPSASAATPAGPPAMRTIVVPVREAVIEDTWHAAGLRGSGSEHYRLEDVFVPHARAFPFPSAPALRGGAAFDLPIIALLCPVHAGFALGAARAALDALAALAPSRLKAWPGIALGAHAGFHIDLGRADAKLRAARALALEACTTLEQRVGEGRSLSQDDWRIARLSVTHATEIAAEVATFAFRSGGASALYDSSPLQRLFRDVQAAAQHIAATDDAYEFAGRLLLGIAAPHPLMAARPARS